MTSYSLDIRQWTWFWLFVTQEYLFTYLKCQAPELLYCCKHWSHRQLLIDHYTSVSQTVTYRPLYINFTDSYLQTTIHLSHRQLLIYHYTSVSQTVTHRQLCISLTDSYSQITIHQSHRQLLIEHYTSVSQTVTHRPLNISLWHSYS